MFFSAKEQQKYLFDKCIKTHQYIYSIKFNGRKQSRAKSNHINECKKYEKIQIQLNLIHKTQYKRYGFVILNVIYSLIMQLKLFHVIYLIILIFAISHCEQQNLSKEYEIKSIADTFPKRVWQYWWQGEDVLPFGLKLTIYRNKRMLEVQGWEYNILDNKSLSKYIQPAKINFKKIFMEIHEADWIRLKLLQDYGGVWMDVNIVILESLDFLFHLKQNKFVVNKFGERPLVYGSYIDQYGSREKDTDSQGNIVRMFPGLQISFLAAVKNASLIHDTRIQIQIFYNDSEGVTKSIDKTLLTENIKLASESVYPYYLATNTAFQACLQRKQHQLDSQFTRQNRKYSVKEYGLWCTDNDNGNYQLQYYSSFSPEQTYALMCSANLDDLQQPLWGQIGVRKFASYWFQTYLSQFYDNAPKITLDKFQIIRRIFKWPNSFLCPEYFAIHSNSFIDRYILNESYTINKEYGLRKDKMQIKNALIEMQFCHPTSFGWVILIFLQFLTSITLLMVCLSCILIGWNIYKHFSSKQQIRNQSQYLKQEMQMINDIDQQDI